MKRVILGSLGLLLCVSGCSSFDRSNQAMSARRMMVGLTKEDVLICMGPPAKKAVVGTTEVWAYNSSGGTNSSPSFSQKLSSSFSIKNSLQEKSSCTVNVVMKNDIVSVVHYNGPRGGLLNPDEQCGYAIEHCVE
jgi:outer membrane protein assembly factor BamE (lipoprotein component of BamABCDE complex)